MNVQRQRLAHRVARRRRQARSRARPRTSCSAAAGPDGVKRRSAPGAVVVGRIARERDDLERPGHVGPDRQLIAGDRGRIDRPIEDDRDRRGRRDAVHSVGGDDRFDRQARRDGAEGEADRLIERDAGGVGGIGADRDLVVPARLERLRRDDLQQLAAPAQLVLEGRAQASAGPRPTPCPSASRRSARSARRAGPRRHRPPAPTRRGSGAPPSRTRTAAAAPSSGCPPGRGSPPRS